MGISTVSEKETSNRSVSPNTAHNASSLQHSRPLPRPACSAMGCPAFKCALSRPYSRRVRDPPPQTYPLGVDVGKYPC